MTAPKQSAAITIREIGGWPLGFREGDDEPRILDTDLGTRLGFDRAENVRTLIKRMISAGKLNSSEVFFTVEQTSRRGGRPRRAFWLTEEQALLVATQSETPKAWALTREIVRVFRQAIRGQIDVPAFDRRLDRLEVENALLRAKVDLLSPDGPGLIGKPRATRWILAPLRGAARKLCALAGDYTEARFQREFHALEEQLREPADRPARRRDEPGRGHRGADRQAGGACAHGSGSTAVATHPGGRVMDAADLLDDTLPSAPAVILAREPILPDPPPERDTLIDDPAVHRDIKPANIPAPPPAWDATWCVFAASCLLAAMLFGFLLGRL